MTQHQQPIIIREKSESTVVALAKIVGLVAASPFILAGAVIGMFVLLSVCLILVGTGTMAAGEIAPWLMAGIILCAVLPAVRARISGKREIQTLKERVQFLNDKVQLLEVELSESRLEVLRVHESAEFHRKLDESARLKMSETSDKSVDVKI